jgi:biopolymer transport protein ExbD
VGMNVGGKGNGPKSDMNVTPLIDVVLVLLIIFMVTMPRLMRNITIEIPRKLQDEEVIVNASNTIIVCGKADGSVLVSDGSTDESVNRVDLAAKVGPLLEKKRTDKIVFVDFENQVAYPDVVSVMDTLQGLGAIVDDETKTRDIKIALKIRDELTKNDPCRLPE